MRLRRSCASSGPIPSIDCAPINPPDPIAFQVAVARSGGQGRRPVFLGTDVPSGLARPENSGRRRSLALDRGEHDGRLGAVRDRGACAVVSVKGLRIAAILIAILPAIAFADPLSKNQISVSAETVSTRSDPYAGFVTEAGKRFAIPERWIRVVMRAESRNKPGAISPKGAMGLMQIMPATWAVLRARHHLGEDAFDPRDNILAGAAYLAGLHDLYGSPGFLAAYNAGSGRYEKHLVSGDPLPPETVDYVAKIAPLIDTAAAPIMQIAERSRRNEWADAPLFVVQRNDGQRQRQDPSDRSFDISDNAPAIIDLSALAPVSHDLFVRRAGAQEVPR